MLALGVKCVLECFIGNVIARVPIPLVALRGIFYRGPPEYEIVSVFGPVKIVRLGHVSTDFNVVE